MVRFVLFISQPSKIQKCICLAYIAVVLFSNQRDECPKTHQTSACVLAEPVLVTHIYAHYFG